MLMMNRLGIHVNVTRVYANTFCGYFLLDVLSCSPALNPRVVAMLNGREALKKELRFKSILTLDSRVYDRSHVDNNFHVWRKEAHREIDETEVPPSVWINSIKGKNPADTLRLAPIQTNPEVVVM